MQVLRIGTKGNDVRSWQTFLTGQGIYTAPVNGVFDEATKAASIKFQAANNLQPDGVVGDKSIGAAMVQGFSVLTDRSDAITSKNFPDKPSFNPMGEDNKIKIFGKFRYVSKPLANNPENIEVIDDWVKKNIVRADIPQLIKIKGSSGCSFHRLAAPQLTKLWKDWEAAGLLHNVLTFDGSYVARFIRGSRTNLSQHAYGSAFDINVAWNGLRAVPALVGQKGCVRELVKIANNNGFYWGGHFTRLDGMHFEVAFIKK